MLQEEFWNQYWCTVNRPEAFHVFKRIYAVIFMLSYFKNSVIFRRTWDAKLGCLMLV